MILQTSFDELNNIIAQKTPVKGLTLAYHAPDTTTVSYLVNILGLAKPSVSVKLKIIGIEGSRIKAQIDAGSVGDFVLGKAKDLLVEKTPEGLIEEFDGKHAIINLDAIPELKSVFENLTVNGLSFSQSAVCVDANLK